MILRPVKNVSIAKRVTKLNLPENIGVQNVTISLAVVAAKIQNDY